MPFVEYRQSNGTIWATGYIWTKKRVEKFGSGKMDIIRVVRPTERKVPEVVGELRDFHKKVSEYADARHEAQLMHLAKLLAKHFEFEAKP